jgi:hypothetical protein
MNPAHLAIKGVTLAIGMLVPVVMVNGWMGDAEQRLAESHANPTETEIAIASVAEDSYCTPALKKIVRRVAGACGLLDTTGRGCQPMEAQKVAQLSDDDFNALFRPLSERAKIIQFDAYQTDLDPSGKQAVEKAWADQRGASFFFVVARASPDGKEDENEKLSAERARSVLGHLQQRFDDPNIKKEVGLMWLGEGFAQLGEEFCGWNRSRAGVDCTEKEINRSAFVAWIDCAI